MKVVTLDSIVSVIRARRGYKKFLSEFINECKIVDAITIPEKATNGDMVMAMFPNAIIEINELGSMVHVKYNNHTCWVNYELDWWNAPYKIESEVHDD